MINTKCNEYCMNLTDSIVHTFLYTHKDSICTFTMRVFLKIYLSMVWDKLFSRNQHRHQRCKAPSLCFFLTTSFSQRRHHNVVNTSFSLLILHHNVFLKPSQYTHNLSLCSMFRPPYFRHYKLKPRCYTSAIYIPKLWEVSEL